MNTAELIALNILRSSGLKVDARWVDDYCRMANQTPDEYLAELQRIDAQQAARDIVAEQAALKAFEASFASMSPADRAGYEAARDRQHMPCSADEFYAMQAEVGRAPRGRRESRPAGAL